MQHLLLYSFANYEGDSWPPRSSPHNAGRMGRDMEAGLLVWGPEFLTPRSSFNLPLNRGGRRQVSVSLGFCLRPELWPHHRQRGPGGHARRHTVGQRWRPKTSPSRDGVGGRGRGSDGRQISRSSQLDGFQSVRPLQIKSVLEANRGTTRLSSATSGGRTLPTLSNKLQSPKCDQWLLERTVYWC